MNVPYFRCEDCGHEFEKTAFMPDVEDDDVVECPECGGMDIQLVDQAGAEDAHQ
jgi:putative FmdB family regulatory protein